LRTVRANLCFFQAAFARWRYSRRVITVPKLRPLATALLVLAGCAATRPLDCGPFPTEYDRVVKEWAVKQKAVAPIQSISFPVKSHSRDEPTGWQVIVETKFGGPPRPTIVMDYFLTIRDGAVVDVKGMEDEVSYGQ
jgi:hypothetical protein